MAIILIRTLHAACDVRVLKPDGIQFIYPSLSRDNLVVWEITMRDRFSLARSLGVHLRRTICSI